eukprot:6309426-Prymnesium_polylepis.1
MITRRPGRAKASLAMRAIQSRHSFNKAGPPCSLSPHHQRSLASGGGTRLPRGCVASMRPWASAVART